MASIQESDAFEKGSQYAAENQIRIEKLLGQGQDGFVYQTYRSTAIKVFKYTQLYEAEKNAYLRLSELGVTKVEGFCVPRLHGYDTTFEVIEMSVVKPPYVLDFAGAYLDHPPSYYYELMNEEWEADRIEQFGAERWKQVRLMLSAFRGLGIFLTDLKPGNVAFPSESSK